MAWRARTEMHTIVIRPRPQILYARCHVVAQLPSTPATMMYEQDLVKVIHVGCCLNLMVTFSLLRDKIRGIREVGCRTSAVTESMIETEYPCSAAPISVISQNLYSRKKIPDFLCIHIVAYLSLSLVVSITDVYHTFHYCIKLSTPHA